MNRVKSLLALTVIWVLIAFMVNLPGYAQQMDGDVSATPTRPTRLTSPPTQTAVIPEPTAKPAVTIMPGTRVRTNPSLTLVFVYSDPSTDASIIEAVSGELELALTGQIETVDGLTWWEVELPGESVGWLPSVQDDLPTLLLLDGTLLSAAGDLPSGRPTSSSVSSTEAQTDFIVEQIVVAVDLLLVYSETNAESTVVEAVAHGVLLTTIAPSESIGDETWLPIITPSGNQGWIQETTIGEPSFISAAAASGELGVGGEAVVAVSQVSIIYTSADILSDIVEAVTSGVILTITDGPEMVENIRWWEVRLLNGGSGWTPESVDGQAVLVHPSEIVPTPTLAPIFTPIPLPTQTPTPLVCSGAPTPIVAVGGRAFVVPGTPNRLRSSASVLGNELDLIRSNEEFSIIGGPVCAEGYRWWQVNFEGQIGWTVDGQGDEYWIRPR